MADKQPDRTDETPRRDDSMDDSNRAVPELDRKDNQPRRKDDDAAHGHNPGPIDPDSAESDIDRDDTVTD